MSGTAVGEDAIVTAYAAPVSAAATPAGKSALGANLNMQSDRIQDHPFTDLVKLTRGFYNLAGRVASNGKPALANTNSNGWPTEAFMFSVADNAEYGVPIDAGTYKMQFKGPAAVAVSVRRTAPGGAGTVPTSAPLATLNKISYDAATGVHTYDINVPQGVLTLALEFRNTNGSVRDIKILQPGYSFPNYPTFTNEYVNLINHLAPNVLRTMDFTATNNNTVANWADRPKTTDATNGKVATAGDLVAAKGVAWEYAIQLANQTDKDLWINIPIQASDDYINQLATLLRNTLEPARDIYVEYSNEVWNTGFNQGTYNINQAKAEVAANSSSNLKDGGTTNTTTWAERRYARETKEIADRFKSVWIAGGKSNPLNNQVKVVLGGQYANLGRFDNELSYLKKFYGNPSDYLYGLGIAPYINLGSNTGVEGLTKDQVLNSLRASITAMQNGSGLADLKSRSDQWGLKPVVYEGGIDTYGPASVAAKRAASLDPAIEQIVKDYLNAWYSKGGTQFNWYTIGARSFNNVAGSWSLTENIKDFNQPKELAFKAIRDLGLGTSGTTPPPVQPPAQPTISINDVSANEGNSGLTPFHFTVTRSGSAAGTTTGTFTVTTGTASSNDLQVVSGPFGFGPGETSKQITVNINGDTAVEADETFSVVLSGVSGGTISDATGAGTIRNDDSTTPPPTPPTSPATLRIDSGSSAAFTDSAGNVWSPDSGSNGGGPNTTAFAVAGTSDDALYSTRRTGDFTYSNSVANGSYLLKLLFTDTNTTTGKRKFDVSVEGNQVLNDFDIVANGGGKTAISKTFPVTISDGAVNMTFTSVVGYAALSAFELTPATGGGTPPTGSATLAINDAARAEGNSGTSLLSFTVTRSGNTSGASTVQYSSQMVSAGSGDFNLTSGTISFAAGEISKAINVTIKGDTKVENDEVFNINLANATGATIADGQGTGTIQNDDGVTTPPATPTISINDISANEGNSGLTAFNFTVTRTGSTAGSTTANFIVTGQSADGSDVNLAGGPLGFGPGETSKQISVNVNGDTAVESDETFLVTLSGISAGSAIGDSSGTGTIKNDDVDSTPPPNPPSGGIALGGGLQWQDQNTRDHAFADLVKATTGFKNLSGGSATTDSNGWPTQDFTVPLWGGSTMDVGTYAVSFTGPSNTVVSLNGGKGTLTKLPDTGSIHNYTIDIPSSTSSLTMKFTGTSGQVKDLHVIQPGNSANAVWSTKYVNFLKSLQPDTLRPMDMVNANYNVTSSWSSAPKLTDARWTKNGPTWESIIDLANTVGSHLWVNVPIAANDDYVKQLAAMLKTRLAPTLRIYVEVGNEVWSPATGNGKYNMDQAKAEVAANGSSNLKWDGTTNSDKWADRRYARRVMEVSNLFKSVWTSAFNGTTAQSDPINNRVRVILGGQATDRTRFENELDYINRFYGAPRNFFYGTGLAWYFSLNKYNDKYKPGTLTKDQVLEGMDLSVQAYENELRFKGSATFAASWGLKVLAYEIGSDTAGSLNVSAKAAAANDPRISGLVQRMVNAFKYQGGDAPVWFRLGANTYNTTSGTWAITENISSLNSPKEQAFRILRGLPPTV